MRLFTLALVFIFGLCFGSFANVCIYRMPRRLNLSKPRSACRKCKKQIFWYNNIPLISYILLKGKCPDCACKIPAIYPIVEFTTGAAFAFLFWVYGVSPEFLLFCIVTFALIAVSGIDIDFQIIPDELSIGLIVLGLLSSFFNPVLNHSPLHSVFGIIAGGGFLYVMGIFGKIVFKKEAMGGGDVKLMAGVGAFVGFDRALLAIFLASLAATIAGTILIALKKSKRLEHIPFGPYLALGSYCTMVLPAPLVIINYILNVELSLISKFYN
jgi:leader peptidase (prepilin peptidase)/N-methyltransferase